MADSSRRKPPLVADKRYSSAKSGAKGTAKAGAKKTAKPAKTTKTTKTASKAKPATGGRRRTKAAARRGSGGGGGGIVGFFKRVIFGIFGLIWGFSWRMGMVIGLLIAAAVGYQYTQLPEMTALLDGRARGSVTLLDRNGQVFAWRGDQFGGVVTTETVSPYLKHAIIATEDRRFYHHFGVSPRGVASAVAINLREGRGPLSGHGGSTITQQTAKLLCLGVPYDPESGMTEAEYEADCRQSTLWRKIKEAIYAMAMEAKYSKDDILTIYMNRAFLGAGARGFEAAAQRYFGKSASDLKPAEAAMLAGLLVAPTRFAPTNNLTRAQNRAGVIVGLMQEQGYITQAQADQARANPAELSEAAAARAGGYFADWVMDETPEFFGDKTTEDVIIKTTLDQRIQTSAEEAMNFIFQEKVSPGSKAQAAIVVMSPDGAVRAMVGGRKTRVSGVFNRATQAKRQTGSAFKPFVYATALDLGASPLDMVTDEAFCMTIPGSGQWCPQNYTHRFYGQVTLTEALKKSLNIPAVKISEKYGRDKVRLVAKEFGLDSDLAMGPALALGASESTLINMTGAYAGILNGGSSVKPYGLTELKLVGDDAPVFGASGGIGERVIRTEAAEQLIWMLEKVVSEGTGGRARLPGWQVAGKTGTSQEARDAWFIGFTADYVTGVWMGYDDNTPLKGVTGSGLPAEIWHETMMRVQEGMTPTPLPMREPIPPTAPPAAKAPSSGGGGLGQAVDQLLRDIFGGGGGGNGAGAQSKR
ncbi:transglycosylase domain-containing protein [Pseudodonghicola flavimaris]|uniref:peptidoglycan glycosyltransferase n=1 Tax=Pseudodonghicola flavimaris TaxID=3050036 RepID=A0ABT7EWE1_9RHOB|nr:PBP1A family penicillin-binding protein [Pseudodonghicola flavimaris]MDK3016653.1 PBP1A family penicillin-binding protein [Pseudodonghicola flavimaris]